MPITTLQPDESSGIDTYLLQSQPSNNFGESTVIQVGYAADFTDAIGLVKFDLSSIPSTALILSATLSLYCSSETDTSNRSIYVFRSVVEWFEGVKNGSPPDGGQDGSTWNLRNTNGSLTWNSSASTATNHASEGVSVVVTNTGQFYDWNVLEDVKNFVNGTYNNYGWHVREFGFIAASSRKSFDSASSATSSQRPKLTIEYYDVGFEEEIVSDTDGKDAYINQSTTGNNWGTAVQVLAGEDSGGSDRVGFLQFDISSIPATATILEANLYLTWSVIQNTGQTLNWYRLLVDWTEGTANGAAGTVNWANRIVATAWNSNGARGSGTDREASASFSVAGTDISVGVESQIDVLTDVLAWHSGNQNYGWAVDFAVTGGTNNQIGFYSGENTDAATRPRLVIAYILEALQGSVSGSSAASGTLRGSGYIDGTVAGTSSHSAELLTNEYILGQSSGVATAVGFMGARVFILGNAFGDTVIAADIKASYLSQASSEGTSSHVADIKGVFNIAGSASGLGTLVANPSFQGQMRGISDGAASALATGYARARSVARVVGCNPVPLFYITDGSIRPNGQLNILNFLATGTGYLLKNYKPQINQYKEGGRFSSSPQSHGRRLRQRVFDNAIDILELSATAYDQDSLIRYQQELIAFQEAAADYWTSEYPLLPYYLVARAANETNTRYAIIHMISCPELENPYEQPFFDIKGSAFGGLTLRVERGFWTSTPPGRFDCVETSSQREWTVSGWQSGS